MPFSRWPILTVITAYSILWMNSVISAELSDSLPVASNGWRPIIGSHEVKPYITVEQPKQNAQHSTQTLVSEQKAKNLTTNAAKAGGGNLVHVNHHGSTGHHTKSYVPLSNKLKPSNHGSLHMMVTGKPALRHPVMNKLHAHMVLSGKRHKPSKAPIRHQLRDEIMAPAPSSAIGTYAFYNQGPFSIQQQQSNTKFSNTPIDFSNHFGFSNNNPNELALQNSQYNFAKQPTQNELQQASFEYQQQQVQQQHVQQQQQQQLQQQAQQHQQLQNSPFTFFNQNNDYIRNLVPPPPHYRPQGEKETIQQKDTIRHGKPENLLLQLQSPYNHFQSLDNQGLDLEITKEKFKEFHTTLAPNYKTTTEPYATKPRILQSSIQHQYEVTEEKDFGGFKVYSTRLPEQPQYKNVYPTSSPGLKYHFAQIRPENVETSGQFLPTPYNPEHTFPTAPTQAEVSAIYSDISQLNQKKQHKYPTPDPAYIKEVATHFPIFEVPKPTTEPEYMNEVTTRETPFQEITQELTHPPSSSTTPQRRPNQRRRRPKPKTTTELAAEEIEYETQTPETERPRRRRPIRYRPTESPDSTTIRSTRPEKIRSTLRPKVTRPQTITEENYVSKNHRLRPMHKYEQEEMQSSQQVEATTREYSRFERPKEVQNLRLRPHKYDDEIQTSSEAEETTRHYLRYDRQKERLRPVQHKYEDEEQESTTRQYSHPTETQTQTRLIQHKYDEDIESNQETEVTTRQYSRFDRPYHDRTPQDDEQHTTLAYTKFERPTEAYDQEQFKAETIDVNPTTEFIRTYNDYKTTESDQPKLKKRKRLRPTSTTTTEVLPITNLNIPENELDYTTTAADQSEEATVQEVFDFSPELTTLITTPSTSTTTRPTEATTKSNRIRPRPNKYEVQRPRFSVKDYRQRLNQYMSSSTTEPTKSSSDTPKIRYPNRFRSTTEAGEPAESYRLKFTPKDPRHKAAESESSTEKQMRPITRIRPYGRHRSTTEATTTTQRVQIKPNIFNNLRRPQHLSLRNRIYNKMKNATSTTEQYIDEVDSEEYAHTERTETTIPFEPAESKIELTTQVYETRKTGSTTEKLAEVLANDVMADDSTESSDETEAFLQLQRIQDLTSSAHKQYNTPGMFKSVTQISRRVPSYFTIATEDPILPIEAFFPNLNRNY